ncbi:MAG: hypothetical protein ABI686_07880 [Acidobacteriota bacterium]
MKKLFSIVVPTDLFPILAAAQNASFNFQGRLNAGKSISIYVNVQRQNFEPEKQTCFFGK